MQNKEILNHLQMFGSITPMDALNRYACFRLAARISDIKRQGHKIETIIENYKDKRYARYYLIEDELEQEIMI